MVFEDWEMNMIVDSLERNDNLIGEIVAEKLRKLQAGSKNKRYSFRSTDWLSEAAKKKRKKGTDSPLFDSVF